MKILIVGSGGREHAIGLALAKSPKLTQLYFAPGNAGTATIGENVSLSDSNIDRLLQFAQDNAVDLTFVGPEAPLVLGIVDTFLENGLKIIGPGQAAAQLEGSKDWAKGVMKAAGIPTARYETFTDYDSAVAYIQSRDTYPIVVKADGLAAGKGVTVAESFEMAETALKQCFLEDGFGEAGHRVVIEDFLKGEEASLFAFTDGESIVPMIPAQDHKAVFDGDKGPNTGGMGAYCPAPLVTSEVFELIVKRVFEPLLAYFKANNLHYTGVVYAGLMIDEGDVSIVEFNVRFGDPETQVVLSLLETDLIDIFQAISEARLAEVDIKWSDRSSVCVVMASGGYPGAYEKGHSISGVDECDSLSGTHVIHAGTKMDGDDLVTNGGRVLAVVSSGESLRGAVDQAYQGVDKISFKDAYHRTDIAFKAFSS